MEDFFMFRAVLLILFLSTCLFAQNKSVYSEISNAKCQTINTSPVSGYLNCAGVGGYNLQVLDDDARMSVNVIAPDQKEYELDLWGHFRNFSSVGEKAEWRMKGNVPIALIIRYDVADRGGDDGKTTSYLLVAKITKANACLTDVVKPGKNQNLTARKLADKAALKPCKTIKE
jgi:hypothetical protein